MEDVKDLVARAVVEYYGRFDSYYQDIVHTQQVASYTRLIAVGERLDAQQVVMLEAASWLHDIGCPLSVERCGNSQPINQQRVGREVSAQLVGGIVGLTDEQRAWLVDVVGTHHQFAWAVKLEYLPLFEADLIVNFLSGYHNIAKAEHLYDKLMTTETGKSLFRLLVKNNR